MNNKQRNPIDPSLLLNTAIIEKSTNRYIGTIGLRPFSTDGSIIEIAYALAPQFHGQGYATEATRALVDEAFKNRGAERISGPVFVGNQPSRRVLEKVHFQYEGTQRRAVYKRGAWIDLWIMAITRPDWEVHY